MKKLFFLIGLVLICACSGSGSDKPMPLSQNNIEEYAEKLGKIADAYEPKPDATIVDAYVDTYKKAMSKVGYDFDATYRYMLVYDRMTGTNPESQLMANAHQAIFDKTDECLQKGLISQRTKDLVEMRKKGAVELQSNEILALDWLRECQKRGPDGLCNSQNFLNVIMQGGDGTLTFPEGQDPYSMSPSVLLKIADDRGHFSHLGDLDIVVREDGSGFNIGWLASNPDIKFKVNEGRFAACEEYRSKLKEERKFFEGK